MRAARLASMRWAARVSAGRHQALHPLPARNEGGGPRRGETNKNAPPLPSPLLPPMEAREKSRSLMQTWVGLATDQTRMKHGTVSDALIGLDCVTSRAQIARRIK